VNLLLEYIKYITRAKGRHGTHSPFVYDFVNKCLNTKIDKIFLKERKKIFKKLRSDNSIINISDFGVGSKKMGNSRKVSTIFKNSSSKGKYSLLLYRLSNHYKKLNILEFGTSLGIGSIHLSKGNHETKVTTVEACNNTLDIAIKNFNDLNLTNIITINSTFNDYIKHYSTEKFDLIFIDGHHDGDALLDYLEKLKALSHEETIFILDDIRWSKSMLKAWNIIQKDEYYHLTMDLFRIGIISPRNQQFKEHFTIRY
jgi:predicted O-methyltransferase YrrM